MQCKIDEGRDEFVKKYGEEAAKALENAYTDAVKTLLASGQYTFVSVPEHDSDNKKTGGTRSGTVSARETAEKLISATVGYNPAVDDKVLQSYESTGRIELTALSEQKLTKRDWGSFNLQAILTAPHNFAMIAWTHEGIHLSGVHKQLGPRKYWETYHDAGFNYAARRLLGE
ncbi:MAG: hypothetical protein R3E77_10340 [Steroidobacteraceae bacterium]